MKKVISGEELNQMMKKSVNLLCDTVSQTLGPTGNNIIINSSEKSPYITNDGVTIAENINSDNKEEDTVLELIKEASLKTNELVGDGTTTTLVLLQSIFNQGEELIKNGKNKIVLKNELLSCMDQVVKELLKEKKKPSKEEYYHIAKTSTNDEEIANITTSVFHKMKSKYSIKLEESKEERTMILHKKGYNVSIRNLSSVYFTKKMRLN